MRRSCHSNGSERTYHSRRAQSIGVVAATVVQGGGAGSQCGTRQLRGSDWGRVAAVRRTEGVVARRLGLEQRRSEVQKVSWHEGLDWSS